MRQDAAYAASRRRMAAAVVVLAAAIMTRFAPCARAWSRGFGASWSSQAGSSSAALRRHSAFGRHWHRPRTIIRTAAARDSSSYSSSSSSSSFQPLPPPEALGTPIFPDVELGGQNEESAAAARRRNDDPRSVFVVTGASRGIGFQTVQSLLERTTGTVVACCRNPQGHHLLDLQRQLAQARQDRRLVIQELDLEDQHSVARTGEEIRSRHDRVDALFHVAGILGDNGRTQAGPERALAQLERSWLEKSMAVHVVGPMMLNQQLLPLLKRPHSSARKTASKDLGDDDVMPTPSIVVHVSARVGSISDNRLGGWYSYRMSKAALNQGTRTLAHELRRHRAICVSYHPGTTETDLSRPFSSNVKDGRLFPVDFSVDRMLAVVDAVTLDHSGGFYDWAGKSIPF